MNFGFIEAEKAIYPVRVLCATLEVSASGYYAWRNRPNCVYADACNANVDADSDRPGSNARRGGGGPHDGRRRLGRARVSSRANPTTS